MSTKYPGGIISKTAVTPTGPYESSIAPGIWTLDQQMAFKKAGQWPTQGLKSGYANLTFSNNSNTNSAVTFDSSGNIFVGGTTINRSFLAKYDANLNLLWQRSMAISTGDSNANAIICDSSGNVYLGGKARNADNSIGYGYIIKYNTSGTLQFQRAVTDGSSFTDAFSLAINPAGDRIVAAGFNVSSQNRGLLFQYDLSGNNYANIGLIATSPAGSITTNRIKFDSSGLQHMTSSANFSAGGLNICVITRNPSNGTITGRSITPGGTLNAGQYGGDLAIASSGNLYITGTSDAGNGILIKASVSNTTVAWTRYLAGTPSMGYNSVVIDSSENVYISATNDSGANVTNAVVVKYDTNGNLIWQRSLNGPSGTTTRANNIAYNPTTNTLAVTGSMVVSGVNRMFTVTLNADGVIGAATVSGQNITISNSNYTNSSATLTSTSRTFSNAGGSLNSSTNLFSFSTPTLTSSSSIIV